MKTHRNELIFNLPARRGFVNITSKVQDCVKESHVKEGLVLVNSMHISPLFSSTTMKAACWKTGNGGSKNSHPRSLTASIATTTAARIPGIGQPMETENRSRPNVFG
jgi:hypothetical protein